VSGNSRRRQPDLVVEQSRCDRRSSRSRRRLASCAEGQVVDCEDRNREQEDGQRLKRIAALAGQSGGRIAWRGAALGG